MIDWLCRVKSSRVVRRNVVAVRHSLLYYFLWSLTVFFFEQHVSGMIFSLVSWAYSCRQETRFTSTRRFTWYDKNFTADWRRDVARWLGHTTVAWRDVTKWRGEMSVLFASVHCMNTKVSFHRCSELFDVQNRSWKYAIVQYFLSQRREDVIGQFFVYWHRIIYPLPHEYLVFSFIL